MTCCFDCKYCKVDPETDECDPDPWICTLTGEQRAALPVEKRTQFQRRKGLWLPYAAREFTPLGRAY